ncbi:MAG: hypothetical protein ABI836_12775 [Gemmatimonadota bacterium]
MRIVLTFAAILAAVVSHSASAQQRHWGITPEIGFSHFHGTARDETTNPEVSAGPSPSTSVGFRLDREIGRVRLGITLIYEETGLVEGNSDISVTANNVLKLLGLHPELSAAVLRLGRASVRAHAGAAIDKWSPADEPSRTRFGLLAGLTLESPLSSGANLSIRWEGTSSRSILAEDDLPAGFELHNTFHSRLGLGIRLGL